MKKQSLKFLALSMVIAAILLSVLPVNAALDEEFVQKFKDYMTNKDSITDEKEHKFLSVEEFKDYIENVSLRELIPNEKEYQLIKELHERQKDSEPFMQAEKRKLAKELFNNGKLTLEEYNFALKESEKSQEDLCRENYLRRKYKQKTPKELKDYTESEYYDYYRNYLLWQIYGEPTHPSPDHSSNARKQRMKETVTAIENGTFVYAVTDKFTYSGIISDDYTIETFENWVLSSTQRTGEVIWNTNMYSDRFIN